MRANQWFLRLAVIASFVWTDAVGANENAAAPAAPRFAELGAIVRDLTSPGGKELPVRQRLLNRERKTQELRLLGDEFLRNQPGGSQRWQVMIWLLKYQPQFINDILPVADESDRHAVWQAIQRDETARSGWGRRLAELLIELEAARELPPAIGVERTELIYLLELKDVYDRKEQGQSVDLSGLRAKLVAFAQLADDPVVAVQRIRNHFSLAESFGKAEAETEYRALRNFPNEQVREAVETKLRLIELSKTPLDLKFVAIDGREVDMTKLRGQVVMVDFWATWCAPCMAEMPNVKAIYERYHERGFEIIGVSCDVAPGPDNSPAWARVAKTSSEVLEFTRKENMPWPQHYEGTKHNAGGNTLAARFAVTGIPAMFLIDQTGLIDSTDARGAKLEQEVRRLLGLPPLEPRP